jgi:hypothetical protein
MSFSRTSKSFVSDSSDLVVLAIRESAEEETNSSNVAASTAEVLPTFCLPPNEKTASSFKTIAIVLLLLTIFGAKSAHAACGGPSPLSINGSAKRAGAPMIGNPVPEEVALGASISVDGNLDCVDSGPRNPITVAVFFSRETRPSSSDALPRTGGGTSRRRSPFPKVRL